MSLPVHTSNYYYKKILEEFVSYTLHKIYTSIPHVCINFIRTCMSYICIHYCLIVYTYSLEKNECICLAKSVLYLFIIIMIMTIHYIRIIHVI